MAEKKLKPGERARIAYDKHHIARAVLWTSCRYQGPGDYGRIEHASFDEALARADQHRDGRTMIYAVTPEGYSIHIDRHNSPDGRVPS